MIIQKDTPLVSVIIPVYNAEKYIEMCINSVLAQVFLGYEIIVIDDGSTDKSLEIIHKIAKKNADKIRILPNKNPKGVAGARNTGLAAARGRWVAFLDADDIWLPNKLMMQMEFMQKNKVAFSFTSYITTVDYDEKTNKTIAAPPLITYHKYLKNTIIGCLTVMIDTEKTGKISFPYLRTSQDMAAWLGLLKQGFVAHGLDVPLATHVYHSQSITASKWRAAHDVWVVYRRVEKLNIAYSAWCWAGYVYSAVMKRL